MAGLLTKLKSAWNAFNDQNIEGKFPPWSPETGGTSMMMRPDRQRFPWSNERSIITSVLTRIAIDCAMIDMRHVRLDDQKRYSEDVDSGLQNCLQLEANIDQAAQQFKLDIFMSLLSTGVIAITPVDTTLNPNVSGSFDILTARVGEIVTWYPRHVRINLYNEQIGRREQITLGKQYVAVVENPLYAVMNEPSSTLQRLIRKLNLLDAVDEASGSGKLDLIIQLPYVVKSESRRNQAEQRRKDIEFQLTGSKYGVAYTDGTEKVIQLNRPAENNLLAQIQYLIEMLYSQLGITPEVMNGTADEATMINYYNRTLEPLCTAVVEAMRRTFLTKTARTQGQSILFFRDPFKLVTIGGDNGIAEIADKLARNEIVTSNELRQVLGLKPSKDKNADQLHNSNIRPTPIPPGGAAAVATTDTVNVPAKAGSPPPKNGFKPQPAPSGSAN